MWWSMGWWTPGSRGSRGGRGPGVVGWVCGVVSVGW